VTVVFESITFKISVVHSEPVKVSYRYTVEQFTSCQSLSKEKNMSKQRREFFLWG